MCRLVHHLLEKEKMPTYQYLEFFEVSYLHVCSFSAPSPYSWLFLLVLHVQKSSRQRISLLIHTYIHKRGQSLNPQSLLLKKNNNLCAMSSWLTITQTQKTKYRPHIPKNSGYRKVASPRPEGIGWTFLWFSTRQGCLDILNFNEIYWFLFYRKEDLCKATISP